MRRSKSQHRLAEVPLFQACSDKEHVLIGQCLEEYRADEGEVIVREGQRAYEFFIVAEGEATVTRNGRRLDTVGPGAFFGELALIDPAPRNATITATSAMKLYVLHQQHLGGLVDEVDSLRRSLLVGMARRLRSLDVAS